MSNYDQIKKSIGSSTALKSVIFTAQSKNYIYCKDAVCQFVFEKNCIPINPFRTFDYWLSDRVDRNLIREANNNLIRLAHQLWVFGEEISDGVLFEIMLAKQLEKHIRYFTIADLSVNIKEISCQHLTFENNVYVKTNMDKYQLLYLINE